MNKKNLTLTMSLLLIALVIATIFLSRGKVVQQSNVPIFLKVEPYVGLAVDKDKLHFGAIPPGGSSRKMLFLDNEDVYDKYVTVKIIGDVKQFLTLSDNNFKLAKGENKTLIVTAIIPKGTNYGNYTGNLELTFKKSLI